MRTFIAKVRAAMARRRAGFVVRSQLGSGASTLGNSLGVIQQRVLDGRRRPFHAVAVVWADDRFHGGLGFSPAIALYGLGDHGHLLDAAVAPTGE